MESSFFQSIVAERQSPSNQEYFATRTSQCFSAATGPSWLEASVETVLPRAQQSVVQDSNSGPSLLASESVRQIIPTVKLETDLELREFLTNHPDAASKMFFVRQRNSASRLSVDRRLFDTFCHRCGIFERIRDYVMCFGLRSGESEVTPPVMHSYLHREGQLQQATALECVYILRSVEPNNRQHGNPWSIRQSGVYNKYNYAGSDSTWLFVAISASAEAQLQTWRASSTCRPALEPLEVHYVLFDMAIGSWRRYIAYLANEIRQQADRAIIADLETDGAVATRLEERQYLKQIEDSVTDLISSLCFLLDNIDVMMKTVQNSRDQPRNPSVLDQEHDIHVDSILKGFEDRRRDLLRYSSQAEALKRKVESASSLVTNILDLNNGNALKVLALESRRENANMAVLTTKSVQDAAMVKVLTIVTLVYLPVTVVTNFFSTQFVNTTATSGGTFQLNVIPEVWILFAASVPLTLITIYVWWVFAQREVRGRFPTGCGRIVRRPKTLIRNPTQGSASVEMIDT